MKTLAILLTLMMPMTTTAISSEGSDYARTVLRQWRSIHSADEALQHRAEIDLARNVGKMPESDKLDYVASLIKLISVGSAPIEAQETGYLVESILGASGIEGAVSVRGLARLLDDCDKNVIHDAKLFLAKFERTASIHDGEVDVDFSLFAPALNDAEANPNGKLVEFMFSHSTHQVANWFAENTHLDQDERRRVEAILMEGKRIEDRVDRFWLYKSESPLDPKERGRLLATWLSDKSWIVQQYACSLLNKYKPWRTTLLDDAVHHIDLPTGKIIKGNDSAHEDSASQSDNRSSSPLKGINQKANSSPSQEATSQGWLVWLLVVIAATAGAVWVFLRNSK